MKNDYLEMDNVTPDGTFTTSSKMNIDMLALRKYCKQNHVPYESLTNEDLKKFEIVSKMAN